MHTTDLQRFFQDAGEGQPSWLGDLESEAGPSSEKLKKAMELFARYAPRAEAEAFWKAEARLRDYSGSADFEEHRSTIDAVYVSAAYSKLALAIATLL